MKKIVFLGSLSRGRAFYFNGQRFKVIRNLGEAGVSVQSQVREKVQIGEREFEVKKNSRSEVWSSGTTVEIETRTTEEEECTA